MSATNRKSLIGHNYQKHRLPPEPVVDTEIQVDAMDAAPPDEQVVGDDNSQLVSMMDEAPSPTHPVQNTTTVSANAFHMYTHGPTLQFFEDLQRSTFISAVQHLVAGACFQNAGKEGIADAAITVKDLCLFFRIAQLVFHTGTTHQQQLGDVLLGFEQRYPSRSPVNMNLPLPTTHKAFVAKLLNPTNTNLLTSILPITPMVSLSQCHAHVPLGPLLAYELSLADATIDPPYHAKFQRLVDSQHGQDLFEHGKNQLLLDDEHNVGSVPVVLV
jgi:hypothetical protein